MMSREMFYHILGSNQFSISKVKTNEVEKYARRKPFGRKRHLR